MTGSYLALAAASVAIRCKGPVEYDGKGSILFRDEVRLEADDLRLECDRLTARLDSENSPTRLKAEGDVSSTAEWFKGSSAGAEYDLKTRVLQLTGPLSVLMKRKKRKKEEGGGVKLACSRRASFRRAEGVGRLEGDCVVEFEGTTLRADEVEFKYSGDEKNPLVWASALNASVEFDGRRGRRGRRGRARRARFDAETGTIELEGDPVLEEKGNSITAPGMRIYIKEKRIVPVGGKFKASTK